MDPNDVRAVYQELCNSYRAIDDFRMKLLGLLPLATGAGIFLLINDDQTVRAMLPFLAEIGAFGFLIALGLFCYELYGIKKCHWLIGAAQRLEIEQFKVTDGQFKNHPEAVGGFVNEPFAAAVIYPAVLAAWIFLALVATPTPAIPESQAPPAASTVAAENAAKPPLVTETYQVTAQSRADAARWAIYVFAIFFSVSLALSALWKIRKPLDAVAPIENHVRV
jgi:hypothetical protein